MKLCTNHHNPQRKSPRQTWPRLAFTFFIFAFHSYSYCLLALLLLCFTRLITIYTCLSMFINRQNTLKPTVFRCWFKNLFN